MAKAWSRRGIPKIKALLKRSFINFFIVHTLSNY
jgi:hypothetical protein